MTRATRKVLLAGTLILIILGLAITLPAGQSVPTYSSGATQVSNETVVPMNLSGMTSTCPDHGGSYVIAVGTREVNSFAQKHPSAKLQLGNARVTVNGLCAAVFSWVSVESVGIEHVMTVDVGSTGQIVFEAIGQYPVFTAGTGRWSGYEAQYCSYKGWFGGCWATNTFNGAQVDHDATPISVPAPEATYCCAWAQWAGVGNSGGANNGVLVQAGIIQTNGNLGNSVLGFYELLPAAAVIITSCNYSSGDYLSSGVVWQATGSYGVYVNNHSTQCNYSNNGLSYPSLDKPANAYYVGEAPVVSVGGSGHQTQVSQFDSQYGAWIYGKMQKPDGSWINFDDNNNPTFQDVMNLGCGTNVQPTSPIHYGDFWNKWVNSNVPGAGC